MRHVVRFGIPVLALVVLGCWTASSSAATLGAEVFGAYNSYGMGDVNDQIALSNQTSSTTYDKLNGGITGGLALRGWANSNWMFSAAWEPLPSKTTSGSSTLDMNANSFQFTGAYFFPSMTPKAHYGIGAGVGYYSLNGKAEGGGSSVDIGGSGIGFHVMGLGEWKLSEGFAVTAGAGYRNADFQIDSKDVQELDGKSATYSGMTGRLGLAFYLPNSK